MKPDWASFLGGKILKQSLPVIRPGNASEVESPVLRLFLPQGELASVYNDEDQPMRYIACIELRSGTTRGNHFHRSKREFVYVLSGEVELLGEDISSQERVSLTLTGGDRAFIAPLVAHALRVRQPGVAIEFSPNRFDKSDTFRRVLT